MKKNLVESRSVRLWEIGYFPTEQKSLLESPPFPNNLPHSNYGKFIRFFQSLARVFPKPTEPTIDDDDRSRSDRSSSNVENKT